MTINTGPAMQRHLAAHGIYTTIIERRRTTKLFHMEVTRDTGVDPAVEIAQRIQDVPGVEVVTIYPDIRATWREDKPVITASLDLKLAEPKPALSIVKPVIIDTSTKFHVGQQVRIAGTSRTETISAVKTFALGSTTWYRFDITAGDVTHMWVAEDRLTGVTILSEPSKWSEPVQIVEAQKPRLVGQTTLFPYGAYKFVA